MWSSKKIILSCFMYLLIIAATACGFKPLYSELDFKKEITGNLKILAIKGKEGFYLREELERRFGKPHQSAYLLELNLETKKINEVITPNNEITSYRLIMIAEYNVKNKLGVLVLPPQKSIVRTGFSSASNSTGYSTQIAEEAAKKRLAIKISEKISTRLLILSKNWLK